MRQILLAGLLAGFLYAGRATAVRYSEILRDPLPASPSATVDRYLEPAGLTAGDLKRAVAEARWPAEDDVLVLAGASAMSPQDLTAVYYSMSYALYPSRVWLATWCDRNASASQCHALNSDLPEAALARYRARRILLIGDEHPFADSHSIRPSNKVSLVSLP